MRASRVFGLCALVVGPLATAGEVKGRLLLDNKPAKGVTVSAVPFESPFEQARREARFQAAPNDLASTTTRPDGSFTLALTGPALAAGTSIRLALSGGGIAPARVWGAYDAGDGEDIGDLRMERASALAGKILDARGKPVVGATVTLWPALSPALEELPVTATSGPDGTFRIEQATESGNRLRVEAPGQALVELPDVRSGALRQPVQLAPGHTAEGVVLKADRRTPAAGAVVRFEGKANTRWVEAGPNGAFRLSGLPAGSGALSADAGELGQARSPLSDGAGKTTLVLAATAGISGRVVDTMTGKPVARIRVLARSPDGLFMARSGADGRYALAGLPGRTYRLSADDPRYVPWSVDALTVAAGAALSHDVLLKPGASFQGRVLDENGAPIEGARALLASPNERGLRGRMRMLMMRGTTFRSGPDGVFTATRVEAGDGQSLNVTHTDYESRTLGGLDLKPGSHNPKLTIVLRRGLSVRGVVKDQRGQPLAEAEVSLSRSFSFQGRGGRTQFSFAGPDGRPKRTTGADGRFVFEGLTAADYTLSVRKAGFGRASVDPVKVAEGKGVEPLEITLSAGATISGFVRDKAGKGVEGSQVAARAAGAARGPLSMTFAEEETGPDGAFLVEGLTPGASYELQLMSAVGLGPRKAGVVAPAEGIEFVTAGSGGISGRVSDADGVRPLADFQVTYSESEGGAGGMRFVMRGSSRPSGPGEPVSVHADDGQFTLADVPVGKWDVEVRADGYQPARVAGVAVEADAITEGIELRLTRGAALSGRVLEAGTGRPIVDAAVQARVQGAEQRFRMVEETDDLSVRSDADGRFEFKGLSAGTYTVSASHPDWSESTEAVTLKGQAASVELRLGKGGTLGGGVVSSGRAVAGASVGLSAAGDDFGAARNLISDEAGRFRFEHLTPGRYSVVASLRSETGAPLEVALQQGQSREDLLLAIGGGALLHGRVLGLPEAELGGVMVNASGPEDYYASTRSATDGTFELSGAPNGPITLRAMAGDFSSGTRNATTQVLIGEGQGEATVEIRFEGGLRLDGHVTRGGQGLADVWVRAYPEGQGGRGASGRTDESGAYRLEGLAEGNYVVSASGSSGSNADVHVQKAVKLSADTTIDLEVPAARLAGIVVEAETGRPLSDARVQLELGGRGGLDVATTDNNGRFAFESLEARVYPVAVQKPAYRAEARDLSASEDSDVRIELRRGEGIGLLAHDGIYGTPLRNLTLRVLNAQGATVFSGSATLDSEGRGEIPSLQPGTYELRAGATGYAPVLLPAVAVPAPQVALTLTPGGTLEIRSGPETQARSGVFARLLLPSGQVYSPWIFSNDGRIALNVPVRRIENVAPGRYTLQVDGGPSPAVDVPEGDTTVLNLP